MKKKRPNPDEQEGILQGAFTRPEVEGLNDFLPKYGNDINRTHWMETLKKAGLSVEKYPYDEQEYWMVGFDKEWCPAESYEFSAIVESYYAYVVRSKWGIKGSRMDGMYPPRVNSRIEGEWIGYSFPPDLFIDGDIKSRIFRLTGEECVTVETPKEDEETCRQTRERIKTIGMKEIAVQMSMIDTLLKM